MEFKSRILFICFVLLCPLSIWTWGDSVIRTVSLKIAADEEFRRDQFWRFDVKRLIKESSQIYEEKFGIRFEVESFQPWNSEDSLPSMQTLFHRLRQSVERGEADIVIGLTSQANLKNDLPGLASYTSGYLLLQKVPSPHALRGLFLHEISHLFGAIDLKESNSIMGNGALVEIFDEFTSKMILLNKQRMFGPARFPIDENRLQDITAAYERRKALNLDETDIYVLLASIYLETNEYEAAVSECIQAHRIDPSLPAVLSLLGTAYQKIGRLNEAIEAYQNGLRLRPPNSGKLYFNLGLLHMQRGEWKEALRSFETTVQLDPNDASAHLQMAFIHRSQGSWDEAEKAVRKALRIDPQLPEALVVLGSVKIEEGQDEEAERVTRQALLLCPQLEEAHNNLGTIHMNRGELACAVDEYSNALKNNPRYPEAHYNLGRAYLFSGLFDRAIEEFEEAIRLKPDYYKAFSNMASAWIEKGDPDKALAACRRAIALKPDYGYAYFHLGRCYLETRQTELAESAFRKAVKYNPDLPEPHNLLGAFCIEKGKIVEGVAELRKALEIDPDFLEAHVNLGHCFYRMNRFKEAEVHYKRAVEIDPEFSLAYNNLAVISFYEQSYSQASLYIKKAEELGMAVNPEFKKILAEKIKVERPRKMVENR